MYVYICMYIYVCIYIYYFICWTVITFDLNHTLIQGVSISCAVNKSVFVSDFSQCTGGSMNAWKTVDPSNSVLLGDSVK